MENETEKVSAPLQLQVQIGDWGVENPFDYTWLDGVVDRHYHHWSGHGHFQRRNIILVNLHQVRYGYLRCNKNPHSLLRIHRKRNSDRSNHSVHKWAQFLKFDPRVRTNHWNHRLESNQSWGRRSWWRFLAHRFKLLWGQNNSFSLSTNKNWIHSINQAKWIQRDFIFLKPRVYPWWLLTNKLTVQKAPFWCHHSSKR